MYEYEHIDDPPAGCERVFEFMQSMRDAPLRTCATCGHPVHRIISRANGFVPKLSAGRLRDLGFTRLVRRDRGVYEKE